MNEYVRIFHLLKEKRKALKSQGSIQTNSPDQDGDDTDAVFEELAKGFWRITDFPNDWRDIVFIHLTTQEAKFLKRRIIQSVPHSLLAWLLENNKKDFMNIETFDQIETMLDFFPEHIKSDFLMAKQFADYIFGAHLRYNVILSNGENEAVNEKWGEWYKDMKQHASLDLQQIVVERLNIRNGKLLPFLMKLQGVTGTGPRPTY
ncbi:MAG: hypothetical protein WAM95_17925 [Bacillus sp. (in: firmicutes)]